ncbi:MAG: hypothetical protein K8R24_04365 [Mycobacterium sp.]|jgi:hypothetical protein|nr:hypothetical protein [Mycobacterium sp.]
MSPSGHSDLGPELRQLAQAILDRLDPAVRAAAAKAAGSLRGPGRCQQVWCPVCALAALVSGEEHPLLTVVAEHSVALMTVIRTMASDPAARPAESGATDVSGSADDAAPSDGNGAGNGRYQHIPIVVEVGDAPEDCP